MRYDSSIARYVQARVAVTSAPLSTICFQYTQLNCSNLSRLYMFAQIMLLAPVSFDVFIMFKGNSAISTAIINNTACKMHCLLLHFAFVANLVYIHNIFTSAPLNLTYNFKICDEMFAVN